MESLRAIQEQLKGRVLEQSSNKRKSLHEEVVKRMSAAEDVLAKEREAEFAQLVSLIPELWAASASWHHAESGLEGVSLLTLVGGLTEFGEYLAEHGHSDMSIVPFFSMTPNESTIDPDDRLAGEDLLRKLVEWTAEVRGYVAAKEVMDYLIAHLAAWFESEKLNHGPEHMQRKAYRQLFHECDSYEEGQLDESLVLSLMASFAESDSLADQEAKDVYAQHLQPWLPDAAHTGQALPSDSAGDSLFDQMSRPASSVAPVKTEQSRAAEKRASVVVDMDKFANRFTATIDIGKFQELCLDVLGSAPSELVWVDFQTHIVDGFTAKRDELDAAYKARMQTLEREAKIANIMERLDIDCSGFIEEDELALLLEHWKEIPKEEAMRQAMSVLTEAGPEDETKILRLGKARFTNVMMNTYFSTVSQPQFERDIKALERLLDRILPDHERFVSRKTALEALDRIAGDSFCEARPIFSKAFEVIREDAAQFSELTYVSAHVTDVTVHGGEVISLQPVAATDEDISGVEGQQISRASDKAVSFEVVKTGLGVHVDSIAEAAGGVKMYKGELPEGIDGAVCVHPLVDSRNLRVQHGIIGTLSVDNIAKDRDATQDNFKAHQDKFYQGVAMHLSDALRLVRIRNDLKRVAHQSVSWVRRIEPDTIANVCWYLVNQGKKDDPMSTSIRKFPLLKREVTGQPNTSQDAGSYVKRGRASAYLFRSAELKDVTSFKQKDSTFISFPVAEQSVVIMLAVVEFKGKKMPPMVERDVRKLVNSMERVYTLLKQGDIPPSLNVMEPASCQWHKCRLDIDALARNKVYFLRFRLVELRRDSMKTFKMLFHNLSNSNKPTPVVLKVIQNMILAFTGENKRDDIQEWAGCRRYINTDLKRAVCEYDPTRENYKNILHAIGKDLSTISRSEVASESQPLVMMLYDWLCICVAISKRATLLRRANTGRPISREKGITDNIDYADDEVVGKSTPASAAGGEGGTAAPIEAPAAAEADADAAGGDGAAATTEPAAAGEGAAADAEPEAADAEPAAAETAAPAADSATPPAADDAATPPADTTATAPAAANGGKAAEGADADAPAGAGSVAEPPAADAAPEKPATPPPMTEEEQAKEADRLSAMEATFKRLDADGDKRISMAELRTASREAGSVTKALVTPQADSETIKEGL